MRESVIVKDILNYLNKLPNCVAEKVMGTATSSGKADINGCYRGKALKIEVKTPDNNNKPSKKQLANLLRWANSGAICLVVYSLEDVKEVINPDKEIPKKFVRIKNGCVSLMIKSRQDLEEENYGF